VFPNPFYRHPFLSFPMSRVSKPLTVARLNDALLGCFVHVKPSATVDHLVRYLGTWSGSELSIFLLQSRHAVLKIYFTASFSWYVDGGIRRAISQHNCQLIQYALKLVVPFLHLRARLQHRAGLRDSPKSRAAEGYAKLDNLLGESRTLWRIWG